MNWKIFQAVVIFVPLFVVSFYFFGPSVPPAPPPVQSAAPIDPGDIVSTDWETLVTMLKHEEGFRAFGYPDTRGFWTIGYGTELPLTNADKNCANHVNLSGSGPGLTKSQGDCLLRYRLSGYYNAIWARWAPFKRLNGSVQTALLDMAYQLGVEGLLGFKLMLNAVASRDWARAIVEARSSHWDKETPSRVDRVVKVFEAQEQKEEEKECRLDPSEIG